MDKADRTDGAERAETTLPAPIRVNSRRLGFMYFAAPMLVVCRGGLETHRDDNA